MNIQLPLSWIRQYLETDAGHKEIAKALTLCGPTVERIIKEEGDYIFDIEVTTNRVDMMNVYGIAREAAASLPQFGKRAKLKPLKIEKPSKISKSLPFKVEAKTDLIYRAIGVIFEKPKNLKSPDWMKNNLEAAGIRSLSAPVDITNYVMLETGHPMHVFDYDKIQKATIIIRKSKPKEEIISLDNKKYSLPGGDIIFQSVDGDIIDLPGIIGTKNSVVSDTTKRFLLFIDNQDPKRIRKTSMNLGIRTMAATINEKGVDPELGMTAILRGVDLFKSITKAKQTSKIYDFYFQKPKIKKVKVKKDQIDKILGVEIKKDEINSILHRLEFKTSWKGNSLEVTPPSFRASDISISEDIIEEVARIYGYYKLPSKLMEGSLPDKLQDNPFKFELKIKQILKSLGGNEILTISLVSKDKTEGHSLALKNPLGEDSKYLRTTLLPSLVNVANENSGYRDPVFLFEVTSVYLPKKGKLPNEKMILSSIFINHDFREAKGVVESLLNELKIDYKTESEDAKYFQASKRLIIKCNNKIIGQFGILESGYPYFEFEVSLLKQNYKEINTFKPLPKYPAQIEDLTFKIPERTKIGEVLSTIKNQDSQIKNVALTTIYKNAYTFRVKYQNPNKTLTDKEVDTIRKKVIKSLKKKFGVVY